MSFTTMHRCLKIIKEKPGVTAEEIPRNIRGAIRELERQGKIEFKNNGWYKK